MVRLYLSEGSSVRQIAAQLVLTDQAADTAREHLASWGSRSVHRAGRCPSLGRVTVTRTRPRGPKECTQIRATTLGHAFSCQPWLARDWVLRPLPDPLLELRLEPVSPSGGLRPKIRA
jgi:hypothetical protein